MAEQGTEAVVDPTAAGHTLLERIELLESCMHRSHGWNAQSWGTPTERVKSLEQAILKKFIDVSGTLNKRVTALEDVMKEELAVKPEKANVTN